MRYLYFVASALSKMAYAELADEAMISVNKGIDVFFLTCDGAQNICCCNPCSNKGTCIACNIIRRKNIKYLDKRIKLRTLSAYAEGEKNYTWDYSNYKELREVVYKHAYIGLATMASYIEYTRNLSPKIDPDSKKYFDYSLNQCAILVDSFEKVYQEIKPDKVFLFNGRLIDSRPIFDWLIYNKKDVGVLEYIATEERSKKYKVLFDNSLPHNIKNRQKMMEDLWNTSQLSQKERVSIGQSFFNNRRNSKPAGDYIYTTQQQKGLLPLDWNNNVVNIGIFNSSEDEFASVGGDYDTLSLFPSQIEGIKYILEAFSKDCNYHFYLRIHPNLKNVKYSYHTDLYDLDKQFNNITIIGASEKIDTYALMDAVDKVIVFGSTMGLEAAFWQKPVILLSASLYYYADVCYIPQTKEKALELIRENLMAKNSEFPIKYGYYSMNYEDASIDENRYSFLDNTGVPIKIGKFEASGVRYQKCLGSARLFLLLFSGFRFFCEKIHRNRLILPRLEA